MNIPSARAAAREEFVVSVNVINPGQCLTLHSGKRHITLKMSDLEHYKGERGRRGNKLPRGFQKVDKAEEEDPAIIGFHENKGNGKTQEKGDPGIFEEPVDGGVEE
jgi:hypothetical protein